jgi:DDE family transposase
MLLLACDRFQSGGATMSDTYRRYGAIKRAIMQFYQPRPTGQREKHLNTLVALICGLVGGKHAHLPTIADHTPSNHAKQESVVDRFRRFLKNDRHTIDGWFLPVAKELLTTLATQPLQVVMDGSVVGRGCLALMLSVVYHGRALPLCWVVVRGAKGHFPEQTHCDLLAQLKACMPADATVIFLGDGEFDGTQLQADLRKNDWHYLCRTAATILVTSYAAHFQVGDLEPRRGESVAVTPAWMTAKQYGPVSILAIWEAQYQEPIYLVTSLPDLDLAVQLYKKRAHIETFFSDQKSRGFQIHKSHLSAPARLSRLLLASCLAYLWIVYLGVCALQDDWMRVLHRTDRCDLSLFRLGLRLVARCLKDDIPIPDGLLFPAELPVTLVRTFHKQAT